VGLAARVPIVRAKMPRYLSRCWESRIPIEVGRQIFGSHSERTGANGQASKAHDFAFAAQQPLTLVLPAADQGTIGLNAALSNDTVRRTSSLGARAPAR